MAYSAVTTLADAHYYTLFPCYFLFNFDPFSNVTDLVKSYYNLPIFMHKTLSDFLCLIKVEWFWDYPIFVLNFLNRMLMESDFSDLKYLYICFTRKFQENNQHFFLLESSGTYANFFRFSWNTLVIARGNNHFWCDFSSK